MEFDRYLPKLQGFTELLTSHGQEAGNAEGFHKRLVFVPTGGLYDDEVEAMLIPISFAR